MLEELKTFAAVVRYKNFTRAGEAVGLSQPGVSAHIHRLENYFGVCLVERSAKRLQITDAGMRVYRSAQEILKILDETAGEIRGGTGQVSGKLHIGGTLTIGECVLPGLMGKFRETYPGVQLELTVENTMEIRRMVREEQVELGFVEGIHQSDEFEEGYFMEDSLVLLTSASHPLADTEYIEPDMLTEEDWIAREEGSGTREYLDLYLTSNRITPRTLTVLGSNYAVKEAIRNDMGITIASSLLAGAGDGIRMHRFAREYVRPFYYIANRNRNLSQAARLFLQMIKGKVS